MLQTDFVKFNVIIISKCVFLQYGELLLAILSLANLNDSTEFLRM